MSVPSKDSIKDLSARFKAKYSEDALQKAESVIGTARYIMAIVAVYPHKVGISQKKPFVFEVSVSGKDVIRQVRSMIGSTDPSQAAPGTIRGDFGNSMEENIIHASDSVTSAEKEINLWFSEGILISPSTLSKLLP